jgi:hypothetical protein
MVSFNSEPTVSQWLKSRGWEFEIQPESQESPWRLFGIDNGFTQEAALLLQMQLDLDINAYREESNPKAVQSFPLVDEDTYAFVRRALQAEGHHPNGLFHVRGQETGARPDLKISMSLASSGVSAVFQHHGPSS